MARLKVLMLVLLVAAALAYPSHAAGVAIANWDWSYDAGMVMIKGTMSNTSGLSLPVTLYVMEGKKTLHEYKMTVRYAPTTEFNFMFPCSKKPEKVDLEWGSRQE